MIKNEREYKITKAQLRKFESALSDLDKRKGSRHALIEKAERDSVKSVLEELKSGIRKYEALKSGRRRFLKAKSFEKLSDVLIEARIALQLTQKELAERLGMKEQQIQRYEATGYSSASLERIGEIVRALGLEVSVGIPLPRREEEEQQAVG